VLWPAATDQATGAINYLIERGNVGQRVQNDGSPVGHLRGRPQQPAAGRNERRSSRDVEAEYVETGG